MLTYSTFSELHDKDYIIRGLMKKIENGSASQRDVDLYSCRIADLKEQWRREMGDLTIEELEDGVDRVNKYAITQREIELKRKGINIKPEAVNPQRSRGNDLVEVLKKEESKYGKPHAEKLRTYYRNANDRFKQHNAALEDRAGLAVRITRLYHPGASAHPCKWCQELAGEYGPRPPSEVFMRHNGCNCEIVVETDRQQTYYMKASGHAFIKGRR